jgi:hypothetical protein
LSVGDWWSKAKHAYSSADRWLNGNVWDPVADLLGAPELQQCADEYVRGDLKAFRSCAIIAATFVGPGKALKIRAALENAVAAKVAEKASADVAYHYTFREAVASITRNGLRPGSYATPNGALSPLQAQIDLALPPNRGLTNTVLRIDLVGLRKAGYDLPTVTRVGRSFNMPGRGYEVRFPYEVPPEYISVVQR